MADHGHETLGGLRDKGHTEVWCTCWACKRFAAPYPLEPLIEKFGEDHSVPLMRKHMKCGECGGKNIEIWAEPPNPLKR